MLGKLVCVLRKRKQDLYVAKAAAVVTFTLILWPEQAYKPQNDEGGEKRFIKPNSIQGTIWIMILFNFHS